MPFSESPWTAEPVVVGDPALQRAGGRVEGVPGRGEVSALDLARELEAPRECGVGPVHDHHVLGQPRGHRGIEREVVGVALAPGQREQQEAPGSDGREVLGNQGGHQHQDREPGHDDSVEGDPRNPRERVAACRNACQQSQHDRGHGHERDEEDGSFPALGEGRQAHAHAAQPQRGQPDHGGQREKDQLQRHRDRPFALGGDVTLGGGVSWTTAGRSPVTACLQ